VEFGDDELEQQANVRDADLLSESRDHPSDNCSSTSYESIATGFLFAQLKVSIRQAARQLHPAPSRWLMMLAQAGPA
jgi:hypothetical protein